jgi:hypothetical protein
MNNDNIEYTEENFCAYCNSSINENETYVVKGEYIYHIGCWYLINDISVEDSIEYEE